MSPGFASRRPHTRSRLLRTAAPSGSRLYPWKQVNRWTNANLEPLFARVPARPARRQATRAGGSRTGRTRQPDIRRHPLTTATARSSWDLLVSLAVGAGLVAVAADLHVAPPAAAVAGGVVEGPPT